MTGLEAKIEKTKCENGFKCRVFGRIQLRNSGAKIAAIRPNGRAMLHPKSATRMRLFHKIAALFFCKKFSRNASVRTTRSKLENGDP